MNSERQALLMNIPGVNRILEDPRIQALAELYPRGLVVESVRTYLEKPRSAILQEEAPPPLDFDTVILDVISWCHTHLKPSLRPAINGTGIILHTGLGRAPFSRAAQKALMETVKKYSTLQIDLETGQRGSRYVHVEELLKRITGAEAAMVVNNNAAATLLILNTLAGGREVIVSRGELIEIGGSFRIPDIMRRSGASLIEVGTTNRTHLKDYREALGPRTAMILRVHQSNYTITGFTKKVPLEELQELAHEHGIPVVDDLGSGAFVDLSKWGLAREPMVQDSVKDGADVICFSGDKLLGGPQCGIIVGKLLFIDRLKKNQLTRALRCDKMTYSVLEATLRMFLDENTLLKQHPVLKMMTEPASEVKKRCISLMRRMRTEIGERIQVKVLPDTSEAGSGSLAAEVLPTFVIALHVLGMSADLLAQKMRLSDPPVLGRIKENRYLLDCRTIDRDEFSKIMDALKKILGVQSEEKAGVTAVEEPADEISFEVREEMNDEPLAEAGESDPDSGKLTL